MTEIYVVRHGQSTWNSEHRWAGQADPPLSELGRLQAKEACSRLKGMVFDHVASSSLQRARETAVIISEALGLELAPAVSELNERGSGDFCGLTFGEIELRFPGLLDKWRAGEIIEIPGGEAWPDFVERVFHGLGTFSSRPGRLLVVCHDGVLRAVEYYFGEKQQRHVNLEGKWLRICGGEFEQISLNSIMSKT